MFKKYGTKLISSDIMLLIKLIKTSETSNIFSYDQLGIQGCSGIAQKAYEA